MWKIKSKLYYIAFFMCLSFASLCNAVGFGQIKVYSYLDEPLVAELEILGLERLDPSALKVTLAAASDFVRAGMERPYFLTNLNFEVFAYNQQVYVSISSAKVVATPYLEFLIDLSWPDGNLIKDYTLLIDPPPKNQTTANRTVSLRQMLAKQQAADKDAESDAAAQAKTTEKTLKKNLSSHFGDGSIKHNDETISSLVPAVVPDVSGDTTTQSSTSDQRTIYEQQRQEFEQQEAAADKTTGASASQGVLNSAISKIKNTKSNINTTVDVKRLADERSKHLNMYKDVGATGDNEAIDFGDVIKPAAGSGAAAAVAVDVPGAAALQGKNGARKIGNAAPGGAGEAAVAATAPSAPSAPVAPSAAPPQKKHGLFLLLSGFGLGLIGAAGFIVKRNMQKKAQALRDQYLSIAPDEKPNFFEGSLNSSADSDFDLNAEEEIELIPVVTSDKSSIATPAAANTNSAANVAVDLDKFEEAFTQLDLDKFSQEETPKTVVTTQSKTMADLLNITDFTTPVTHVTPAAPEIKPDIADVKPEVKLEPAVEIAPETNPSITELKLEVPDLPIAPHNALPDAPTKEIGSEIHSDEDALRLKLKLAKQYLDADDKDSARLIINEVIESAKDDLKLEAEIMLSGIL